MSGFAQVLESGRFALTTEIIPPLSLERGALAEKLEPLRGLIDAVNLTDGAAARASMDTIAATALAIEAGFEPIVQMTCRDRNRIALQSAIVGAVALGARAFLFLSGDDPEMGDEPQATVVDDLDSPDLVQAAIEIASGRLPGGRRIEGAADVLPGAGTTPRDPRDGWRPDTLLAKIAAGARFTQTQYCMDGDVVRRYIARLRASGVPENFRILIGVAPFTSAGSARWIRDNLHGSIIADAMLSRIENADDEAAEGIAICADYVAELATIDGVAGAHIMASHKDEILPEALARVRDRIG